MSARSITLADAVTAVLKAAYASAGYDIARAYLPEETLPELGTLKIRVLPVDDASELVQRPVSRQWKNTIQIQVGIAKRLDPATANPADPARLADVDALVLLCDQVEALFPAGRFGTTGASLLSQRRQPLYDEQRLRETKTFFSVITLTFVM